MKKQKPLNDTSPEAAQKMCELIREKTPQERFAMGLSMCETSRILVTQAILRENPNISPLDFKKELFLRYYGSEFTKEQKKEFFRMLESRYTDIKKNM